MKKLTIRIGSVDDGEEEFFATVVNAIASQIEEAVEYGDVTLAIQDAAYGALQDVANGDTADATAALQGLQTKLQTLIKQ